MGVHRLALRIEADRCAELAALHLRGAENVNDVRGARSPPLVEEYSGATLLSPEENENGRAA